MASGDVTVITTTPSNLKAALEAASVASTWGFSVCSYGAGQVCATIIEP
jgi:hypothetical protein